MNYLMLAAWSEAATSSGEEAMAQAQMGSLIFSTVLLLVFFYFFMVRPQKKKEKEQKEMRDSIQIGDEVTTIGGITGIVVRKTEDTVVIETGGDRNKVRVKIWAVSENATKHDAPPEEGIKLKKKSNADD